MRAVRMTLSLCHSVAEEHDLIVDVESRPERRRQEYIRALLNTAVESQFEGISDLLPSGVAAATHRMVIHLNAEIPADEVILRFVECGAAPARRAELLRRLLIQARRQRAPFAALPQTSSLALATRSIQISHEPSAGAFGSNKAMKSSKPCPIEVDFVLPDEQDTSAASALSDASAGTPGESEASTQVPRMTSNDDADHEKAHSAAGVRAMLQGLFS